jgi:hypothetical protein
MHAACVDQKLLTVITDSGTEVISDAFVVIKSGSPAKCSG